MQAISSLLYTNYSAAKTIEKATDVKPYVRIAGAILLMTFASFLVGCSSSTAPIAVTLGAAPTAIDQGQTSAITATVANDSKNAGVTWGSVSAGSLSGTTTAGAIYTAPNSVTSQTTVTVTATSITDTSKSGSVQITVNPLPTISTTNPPGAATAGVAYSYTLAVSGGTAPFTWSLNPSTQTLPAGLSLNASTGVISGMPTNEAGSSTSYTFQVTDATGVASPTQAFTIKVNPAPKLTVTTASLPGATAGTAYSATVTATGGIPAYAWSLINNPPSWLSINSSTGQLSGTPTTNTGSPVSVTVQVTDSQANQASSSGLSIAISIATLTITTTSLPAATVGQSYSATVGAKGGVPPYTWSLSGQPSWLSINTSTGALSGTAPSSTGTTPQFSVQVQDSEGPPNQISTANFTITINAQSACTGTLNNGLLNGHYAFMMKGWSGSTTATSAAGSFVADGSGDLSGGLIDVADQSKNPGTQSLQFTGTYCVGSDNLAILTVNPTGGNTATFAAALDASDGNGHIIGYDTSGKLISGLLRQQTTSAFSTGVSGNYAFGLVGADQGGSRFALAGHFDSNGGSLSGEADYDDSGSFSPQSGNPSLNSTTNLTVNSTTGRGTATISFSSPLGTTWNFVFYVVNTNELIMMALDSTELTSPPTPWIMTGRVFSQASNLTFSGTAVMAMSDIKNSAPDLQAGTLTITSSGTNGTFSLAMDDNQAGTLQSATITGDYNITSDGRTPISGLAGCPGGCTNAPIFYLYGTNLAFEVGTGGSGQFGNMIAQTGTSFTASSLAATYMGGTEGSVTDNGSVSATTVTFSSTDETVSGTEDKNSLNGGVTSPTTGAISADYCPATSGTTCSGSSSNGRFLICTTSGCTAGSLQNILYMISDSEWVIMDADSGDNNPKIEDFHQ